MKIVVVGGTGLIGSRVVSLLQRAGHSAVAAARATGVNSYTADGLPEALDGAEVVVDVSTSPYTDYDGALDFFETSTLNLLTYGRAAGVGHHVALSVVGTDRLAAAKGRYFLAKARQEELLREATLPYSIVHTTQFFEFLVSIADSVTDGGRVRPARARIQPIAADDVADAVMAAALGEPTLATAEHAGPDVFDLDQLLAAELDLRGDPREVVADPLGDYFGARLEEDDLLPGPDAVIAPSRFADWVRRPEGARIG
ncbi:SDR family oxidoreductase [Naasia aerilata]|uniref:LysR family transcriptional regulator n=1 Tax=Naasia aerilata TaxID=1162966 RepID=A0ABN6XN63_9MICO|nr:NAD(P)H-binding protein [Naasia aerilata]BDZ46394.1 LysR family transcriptional regulator [Naasia aerilata]